MLTRGQVARQPRQAGKRFRIGTGKNNEMSPGGSALLGVLKYGKRGGCDAAPLRSDV
jgi:hypothetical protein